MIRCLQRIRACLTDPVETEWVDGQRHVQVLGRIVLRFAPYGTITPYLWELGENLVCEEVARYQINLAGMPYGWLWLDRFRDAFEHELVQRLGERDYRVSAYAAWFLHRTSLLGFAINQLRFLDPLRQPRRRRVAEPVRLSLRHSCSRRRQ